MLADYFIIICYLVIIVGITENIIVIVLSNSEDKKAKTMTTYLESRVRVLVWLIFPCCFFFLFIPWWAAILCVIGPSCIYISLRYESETEDQNVLCIRMMTRFADIHFFFFFFFFFEGICTHICIVITQRDTSLLKNRSLKKRMRMMIWN
jgi:hypothetical protein